MIKANGVAAANIAVWRKSEYFSSFLFPPTNGISIAEPFLSKHCPPSWIFSAPATPHIGMPPFGLGPFWLFRQMDFMASHGCLPVKTATTTINAPVILAGIKFAMSSILAENQPKLIYFWFLYPTMLSRVFMALYA